MKTLRSAFIRAEVTSVAKKIAVDCHLYYGRANRKCRRKLLLRSRQSKNFLSRQTQKRFGRRSLVLRSPQLQKKMRSPDYFVLVAPVIKTFGRVRRKNFCRWSFLPRSRQSLKQFPQRLHVLLLKQSKQNSGRLKLVLRPRQSQKLSVAPGTKKKRSAVTSTSLALVRKKVGRWTLLLQSCQSKNSKVIIRARRKETSDGIHFYIVGASR